MGNRTIDWYKYKGWMIINAVLTELAAKEIESAYIENFEIFPTNLDEETLIEVFNEDSSAWRMRKDREGNLICYKKTYLNR